MVILQSSNFRNLSISIGILAATAQSASPLAAQTNGPYVSIGPAYLTSDADEIENVSEDSGHIQVRVGYAFNDYLALETEGSIAVLKSDAGGVGRDDGRLILDRSVAGFVVARYPASDRISLFVRGGYHYSRLSLRADDFKQSAWRDDFAYGAGAAYSWDTNAVRFDYTVLNTDLASESIDHRSIAVSYVRSF